MKIQTKIAGMLLSILFFALSLPVHAGLSSDDPMVKITSLPLKINTMEVMKKVSREVARDTGLDQKMLTYYWQTFDAIYCPSSKNPEKTNIVFVDLYVPGFMTDKDIAGLMTSLANSLEKNTGISKEMVFIQTHFPKEGHVYISGKIAKWSDFIK